MAALLRRNLVRAGHSQVSSGPETDVVRQGPARTGHEICDALNARELHLISGFLLILVLRFLLRCIAGEKPLDHKLQETVLGGKLRAASKSRLTDLINRIAPGSILAGKPHMNMVITQPPDQAHETGVHFQDVRAQNAVLLLELKGGLFLRIGKNAAGMMFPLSHAVGEHKDRLLRRSRILIGCKGGICTNGIFCFFC